LEGLSFETPTGTIRMALGKGHQAIEPAAYGMTKTVGGRLTFTNVKHYPPERVNPPEGTKSADWIKATFSKK
jgi:branched-chain amino acid transport system substrate-binding protein